MNAKTVFRLLLVAILIAAIAGALVASFPGNISEDWRTIAEWNGDGGFYKRFESFTLPTHAAGRVAVITALVLLLLFWSAFMSAYSCSGASRGSRICF